MNFEFLRGSDNDFSGLFVKAGSVEIMRRITHYKLRYIGTTLRYMSCSDELARKTSKFFLYF
jgi:hypothetical protein